MAVKQTGTSGADTLTGGADADTLVGAAGDDTYIVTSLLNVVLESTGSGIDTIKTGVLDTLKTYSLEKMPEVENLSYTGALAAQLKGNAGNNVIQANAATGANDTLYGGNGNDELYGYGGKDMLMGGNGNDTLDGGIDAVADTLIGGINDDTYLHVSATDVVIETPGAAGFDLISTNETGGKYLDLRNVAGIEGLKYDSATAGVLSGNGANNLLSSVGASNDTINGGAGNDTINGGAGADSLIGGVGDDDIDAGAGADTDTMAGGAGDDIYFNVGGADVVKEVADGGRDTIIGVKTSLAVSAFATTVENLLYTGASDANIAGNALDNILGGGAGNDTIVAAAGNDLVVGGSGADNLQGGSGADTVYGGAIGNLATRAMLNNHDAQVPQLADDLAVDTLIGGNGGDTYVLDNLQDVVTELAADSGIDVIRSTIDNSLTLYSNIEALVLDDNQGSTAWFAEGDANANILLGNNNENYLSGGAGNDTMSGDLDGSGTVYTYYGWGPVTDVLDGGDGNDLLLALAHEYSTTYYDSVTQSTVTSVYSYTSNANNVLLGGAGNDFYVIQNEKSAIYDDGGSDTIYMMTSGLLEASEGVERIVLAGGSAADDAIALAAINAVRQADDSDYTPFNAVSSAPARDASGNALNNVIIGNDNNNSLLGMDGNDSLVGGAGNDTLSGDAGTDTLVGGVGDDVYVVDAGDVVTEAVNGGTDIIRSATLTSYAAYANIEGLEYTGANGVLLQNGSANTSVERFTGGAGDDTLNGWGGADNLSGGAGDDSIDGGVGDDSLAGGFGADSVFGGDGNDTIGGGDQYGTIIDQKNTLYGGAGNDSVSGANGLDVLYGEAGNDTLLGGLGADTVDGGDGNDLLSASWALYQGDTTDTSANVLTGGAGNDTLYGSAGADKLSGGADLDYLVGGNGNDTLAGEAGNDMLYGGAGNDSMTGGTENDQLTGEAGNDSLSGNEGSDTLYGSEGSDSLNGNAGNDMLEGGADDDILYAGLADASPNTYSTSGDKLIGDFSYNYYNAAHGKDTFRFETTAAFAAQSVQNGSMWDPVSGTYVPQMKDLFNTGHFVDDFIVGEDKIQFAKAMVGDGDTALENVAVKAAAGGTFAKSAEMVIVQADLSSDFTSMYGGAWSVIDGSQVVAAIGAASSAFALGDKRLFVVDDGIGSALFQFVSAGADATVSAAELRLIGVVDGQASLAGSDFGLY